MNNRFQCIARGENGLHHRDKMEYRIRLEKGLIVALSLTVMISMASKKLPQHIRQADFIISDGFMTLDMVPATSQGGMKRPPDLPEMPVPVEDDFIPEDETIETTELDVFEGIPLFEGPGYGVQGGGQGSWMPRPIREVIPEYPPEERENQGEVILDILVNRTGRVDSVHVIQNTSSSKRLERAAVEAVYKSRYMPYGEKGKQESQWIRRSYKFERK